MERIEVDRTKPSGTELFGTPPAPLGVTRRIVLILDCFRNMGGPLTLTEISHRTELPTSTVHRLLHELCKWNVLLRSPEGYRVSLWLFEVGVGAVTQERVYRSATPVMQDIFNVTGENVQLSMLDNGDVVFIAKLIGRRSRPIISRTGGRLPAFATASGRVMLAYSDASTVDRVLEREKQKYTQHTITDPNTLRTELQKAVTQGFVVSVDEVRIGTSAVAAPVFSWSGSIVAALSVVGSTATLSHRRSAAVLQTAAMSLSRSIPPHETAD